MYSPMRRNTRKQAISTKMVFFGCKKIDKKKKKKEAKKRTEGADVKKIKKIKKISDIGQWLSLLEQNAFS